jgi:hypothetical protein
MTAATLRIIGNILYFIGLVILVPSGMIILTSVNTFMLAGPIALLVPIIGGILGGTGKYLRNKAKQIEVKKKS